MPAAEIEKLIVGAVRKHFGMTNGGMEPSPTDIDLISTHVARVEVQEDQLAIQLPIVSEQQTREKAQHCENGNDQTQPVAREDRNHTPAKILLVPWKKPKSKQPRQIIPPATPSSRQDRRPIRAETRAKLVTAIATARQWLDELVAETINNVEQIADREKCSIRQVNRTITLAFLAPGLVQAAIEGQLPRGIGVAKLRDLPIDWAGQYERLGLSGPPPVP